jgi:hypothetical protein
MAALALGGVACHPADVFQIVAEESFADRPAAVAVAREEDERAAPEALIETAAEHPPPPDPELVGQLSAFMVEFCTRVRRANGKYIEQHVELPLTAVLRQPDEAGDEAASRTVTYRNAWEFKESGICADLTWLGCGLDVREHEDGWRVRAGHGSAAMELTFEPLGKSYRLVGIAPASLDG